MIKILCVEDHLGTARLIQLILKKENPEFEITQVSYLSDALKIIDEQEVNVILLDLNLPDSQGIDTIKKVLNKAPNIPVVIMTGLGDEEITQEAIKFGAKDFLVKGDFEAKYLSNKLMELYKIKNN